MKLSDILNINLTPKITLPATTVVHMRSSSLPTQQQFDAHMEATYPSNKYDTTNVALNNLIWWDISAEPATTTTTSAPTTTTTAAPTTTTTAGPTTTTTTAAPTTTTTTAAPTTTTTAAPTTTTTAGPTTTTTAGPTTTTTTAAPTTTTTPSSTIVKVNTSDNEIVRNYGTWALTRDYTSTGVLQTVTSTTHNVASTFDDKESQYSIARYLAPFNIPSGNNIVSATLHFYVNQTGGTNLVSASIWPNASEPIDANEFYDPTGLNTLSSNTANTSTTGWKTLTLTAGAISHLNSRKGATAIIALRCYTHDYLNSAPTIWKSCYIRTGNYASFEPYLTLNY